MGFWGCHQGATQKRWPFVPETRIELATESCGKRAPREGGSQTPPPKKEPGLLEEQKVGWAQRQGVGGIAEQRPPAKELAGRPKEDTESPGMRCTPRNGTPHLTLERIQRLDQDATEWGK